MARTCTICTRPEEEHAAIDQALVAGEPYRYIAKHFGTSVAALQRHKESHLRQKLAQAQQRQEEAHDGHRATVEAREAAEERQAIDVLKQLRTINAVSVAILHEAREAGEPQTALKAIDRLQRQIELQAKLLGELDERPQVNVLLAPQWLTIRTALLGALGPYPDARVAVAAALGALDGGST